MIRLLIALVLVSNFAFGQKLKEQILNDLIIGSPAITGLINTVAPAITGADSFVNTQWTVTDGTWTGSPTSFTYQWKRAGASIGSATNSTYTLVIADVGSVITCTVTAHKSATPDVEATSNATSTVDYPTVGTIFTYPSFASLTDFSNLGSGNTLVSNYIQMTGGAASFNDKIKFNVSGNAYRYTVLEDWVMRVGYRTPTAINGTSYGIGIGVDSDATDEYSTSVRWCTDNATASPNIHQVAFYTKRTTNNQVMSGSGTVFTPVAATDYVLELTRAKNVFTFRILAANGVTQLLTTTFTTSLSSGSVVQPHNTGRFTIQNFGGTNQRINFWTVTSTAKRYLRYVGVGDSNMAGLFAGSLAARYFDQVMTTRSYVGLTLAGTGDRAADVVLRLPEIVALAPQNVYLNILSNDVANGVASGTYQANYNTILSTLSGAGITVILGTPVARNVDITAAQTFINGKANTKIDLFALTKNGGNTQLQAGYSSGDGIHMNAAGNNACATSLLTIIP